MMEFWFFRVSGGKIVVMNLKVGFWDLNLALRALMKGQRD